jgi:hypothetical protein
VPFTRSRLQSTPTTHPITEVSSTDVIEDDSGTIGYESSLSSGGDSVWFRDHNRLYADIVLDPNVVEMYPEGDVLPGIDERIIYDICD